MSTSQKHSNVDPRIAPKEMILTRRKSAMQKQQLRDFDKSMKNITQLLKNPMKKTKSPKKNKNIEKKKVNSSKNSTESEEFYPDKLKRSLVPKKVLLKPKHEMKVVAATNKRKRRMPKKDIKSPLLKRMKCESSNTEPYRSCTQSPFSEVSDSRADSSLDEEDWMEILTCPSPVWWEDPPEGYIEEAICTRKAPTEEKNEQTNKQTEDLKLNINLKERNTKFIQKRSKLENLLNNIKNKTPINISDKSDSKSRISDEEDMLSDLSVNEEEILRNLENINIPIEAVKEECDEANVDVAKSHPILAKCLNKVIKDSEECSDLEALSSEYDISDSKVTFLTEEDIEKSLDRTVIETNVNAQEVSTTTVIGAVEKIAERSVIKNRPKDKDSEYITVYKIMAGIEDEISPIKPKLNTIRVKNMNKLINPESSTNINLFFKKCKRNRLAKAKEIINLSKTDIIKPKKVKILSKKDVVSPKKDEISPKKDEILSKKDVVFPKKDVVSPKTDEILPKKDEILSIKNAVSLKKDEISPKNDEILPKIADVKNKVIRDDKVKYCYKCSSIFDTTECSYCKSEVVMKQYSCDQCDFVSTSRTKIIKHMISHKAQDNFDKL